MKPKLIISLFLSAIALLSCAKKQVEQNEQYTQSATIILPSIQIDTTANLIVFKPYFSRVELEVGEIPSMQNDSVIFCAAAAFTSQLKTTFSHDNIVGAYITHGKHYLGYQGGGKYGRFVYANNHWKFIDATDHATLDSISNQGGCAFTQMWVIQDNKIYRPYARKDSTQQNIYRCICEKDNELMIAQCRRSMPYHQFVAALKAYGCNNALYMDMGSGWNHSFYRDNNDSVHIIFPHTHNYCTNWITFYKD